MENPTYRVILAGSLREGFATETVVRNLAVLFKRDEERVRKLLSGKPVVVRAQLDSQTARKYRKLIERAGAVCLIEAETPTPEPEAAPASAEARRPSESPEPSKALGVCSRCGYEATTDNDVLVVRGDCPKCGLMAKGPDRRLDALKPIASPPTTADPFYSLAGEADPYAGGYPATAERRVLASIHSLGTFLILYSAMTVMMVLLVAPTTMVFHQLFRVFFETAFTVAPMAISLSSIAIITVAIPLCNDGLTLGQRKAGIGLVFSQESLSGGPYFSLVLRGAGAALLSLVPGQLVVSVADWFGFLAEWRPQAVAMCVTAAAAWGIAGVVWSRIPSKVGFVDYCSGTAQIETVKDAPGTVRSALLPVAIGGGFLVLVGVVVPLLLRLAGR